MIQHATCTKWWLQGGIHTQQGRQTPLCNMHTYTAMEPNAHTRRQVCLCAYTRNNVHEHMYVRTHTTLKATAEIFVVALFL